MSENLNQNIRRTITDTQPVVSSMKSFPKVHIPTNKKKEILPGSFFQNSF